MTHLVDIRQAAAIIKAGGVVAYPTEFCYGLGCDPRNRAAISRILKIKRRNKNKGLIVVSDYYYRLRRFIAMSPNEDIRSTWPGPNTWLLPAKNTTPKLLTGQYSTLAVRVSAHYGSRMLCCAASMAIVSTSANRANRKPLRKLADVMRTFNGEIDAVVVGRLGNATQPSTIRDSVSGRMIRG